MGRVHSTDVAVALGFEDAGSAIENEQPHEHERDGREQALSEGPQAGRPVERSPFGSDGLAGIDGGGGRVRRDGAQGCGGVFRFRCGLLFVQRDSFGRMGCVIGLELGIHGIDRRIGGAIGTEDDDGQEQGVPEGPAGGQGPSGHTLGDGHPAFADEPHRQHEGDPC